MNSKGKGIGFTGLLALIFIVLKLCNVIQWSWLWVIAPIWIPIIGSVIGFIPYYLITRKPRKAVYCSECKFRGCRIGRHDGAYIRCRKDNCEYKIGHYCKQGEKGN